MNIVSVKNRVELAAMSIEKKDVLDDNPYTTVGNCVALVNASFDQLHISIPPKTIELFKDGISVTAGVVAQSARAFRSEEEPRRTVTRFIQAIGDERTVQRVFVPLTKGTDGLAGEIENEYGFGVEDLSKKSVSLGVVHHQHSGDFFSLHQHQIDRLEDKELHSACLYTRFLGSTAVLLAQKLDELGALEQLLAQEPVVDLLPDHVLTGAAR